MYYFIYLFIDVCIYFSLNIGGADRNAIKVGEWGQPGRAFKWIPSVSTPICIGGYPI